VSHALDYFLCAEAGDLSQSALIFHNPGIGARICIKSYSVYSDSELLRLWASFLLCLCMSCNFMSCIFMSYIFMSYIFMSCNFMSFNFTPSTLVRHFHVLQFPAQHIGPSFSCPAISCLAYWSVNFMSCVFMSVIFSAPSSFMITLSDPNVFRLLPGNFLITSRCSHASFRITLYMSISHLFVHKSKPYIQCNMTVEPDAQKIRALTVAHT